MVGIPHYSNVMDSSNNHFHLSNWCTDQMGDRRKMRALIFLWIYIRGPCYLCSLAITGTDWNVSQMYRKVNFNIQHQSSILPIYFRIYGVYLSDGDSLVTTFAMTFKGLEGIVEAGPQLVLQLYIITRNGMDIRNDMSLGGKFDFGTTITIR